jgi:hypothetical protein
MLGLCPPPTKIGCLIPCFKSYNFAQNLQLCSKVTTLLESYNFVWKLQLCSKVTALFESYSFVRKPQLCSKVTALFESHSFVRKLQLCSKVTALFESYNFARKSQLCSKVFLPSNLTSAVNQPRSDLDCFGSQSIETANDVENGLINNNLTSVHSVWRTHFRPKIYCITERGLLILFNRSCSKDGHLD